MSTQQCDNVICKSEVHAGIVSTVAYKLQCSVLELHHMDRQ